MADCQRFKTRVGLSAAASSRHTVTSRHLPDAHRNRNMAQVHPQAVYTTDEVRNLVQRV